MGELKPRDWLAQVIGRDANSTQLSCLQISASFPWITLSHSGNAEMALTRSPTLGHTCTLGVFKNPNPNSDFTWCSFLRIVLNRNPDPRICELWVVQNAEMCVQIWRLWIISNDIIQQYHPGDSSSPHAIVLVPWKSVELQQFSPEEDLHPGALKFHLRCRNVVFMKDRKCRAGSGPSLVDQ